VVEITSRSQGPRSGTAGAGGYNTAEVSDWANELKVLARRDSVRDAVLQQAHAEGCTQHTSDRGRGEACH